MIEIDPTRFKLPPFKHQLDGIKALSTNENFALFDEMGVGKTKQVIDAAGVLFDAGLIDTVVVACPAQVKTVWLDPDLGEIVKHSWVPSSVFEFSSRAMKLDFVAGKLNWVITSYEFLRQETKYSNLMVQIKRRKTWLVLDESIFVKNPKARQSKACFELRKVCKRATLLNGTPISNNPLDLYAQLACLDKSILGFKNFFAFRNHHAKMGGYLGKQVIGFVNVEEMQAKIKPFVLRRLKKDCLDLLPKLYTQIEVPLTPKSWKIYKDMKEEMVAWLGEKQVASASQAAVKGLRLAQITSGFLGGIQSVAVPEGQDFVLLGDDEKITYEPPMEIGDEKLKAIINDWLEAKLEYDRAFRCIIWCRFRAELNRFYDVLTSGNRYQDIIVHKIQGGQSRGDREAAKREFQAGDERRGAILLGNPQAGGFGLTLTRGHSVVYASNDYNLLTRLQSEDRVHRPGQLNQVTYTDVIATGPNGQRTIDHAVVKALRNKEEIARWTTEKWRSVLEEE